jgi:hypothetical protein
MGVVESVTVNHHFKHLMLPINLQKKESVEKKTQSYYGQNLTIIECAKKFRIDLHVSGSLGQAEALDSYSPEEYLSFLVNKCGCDSYFIGSKRIEHINENIKIIEKLLY